jgi:hypothetical protein
MNGTRILEKLCPLAKKQSEDASPTPPCRPPVVIATKGSLRHWNPQGPSGPCLGEYNPGEHSLWIIQHGVAAYTITLPTIPMQWHVAAAADFLGTGQADLAWENTITGERSLRVMENGVRTRLQYRGMGEWPNEARTLADWLVFSTPTHFPWQLRDRDTH